MMTARATYRLGTLWRIEAPVEAVYDAILQSLQWPDWWEGVENVENGVPGDRDGTGNVRRYTWKGGLPYRVTFDARTTTVKPMTALEAAITGDLEGTGRWLFANEGGLTEVRFEWRVSTTRPWMNLLAPIARPVFVRNHRRLMESGAAGLARLLQAPYVEVVHGGPIQDQTQETQALPLEHSRQHPNQ